MDSKLSFLLFLTTLAGSSLAQENGSCAAETKIGERSAKIQRAEDSLIEGLAKAAKFIGGEVLAILTDKSKGLCINSTEAESRSDTAENKSLAAFLVGIPPTLEAIAIFQTKLDIPGKVECLKSLLETTNINIWLAIEAVRVAENYSASQAELANMVVSGRDAARAAIDELIDVMLNGTAVIPKKAENVIAYLRSQATSEFQTAAAGILEEINILLEAIYKAKSQDDFKKYSSQIAAAENGVLQSLRLGVVYTFSILRIVSGLFALQAASGNRTSH